MRLADQLDVASGYAEAERTYAATLRKPEPRRTGRCHSCGERLESSSAIYCDADCQEDDERRARLRRINGLG